MSLHKTPYYMKKISEITPLILGFLVFNGFLKQYLFYNHWNIEITEYLDFGEILLSFLDDINIIVLFSIVFILQQFLGAKTIEYVDNMIKSNTESTLEKTIGDTGKSIQSSDSFTKVIDYILTNHRNKIIIVLLILTAASIIFFLNTYFLFFLYISTTTFLSLLFLIFEDGIFSDDNLSVPISLGLTVLGFTSCLSKYDINEVSLNSTERELTVYTDDEKIQTTENYWYLGKTQNYIFFYDNIKCSSYCIPTDRIKYIQEKKTSIKNRVPYLH